MKPILFLHSSADLYGADRCLLRIVESCRNACPLVVVPYEGPLVNELRRIGVRAVVMPMAVLRRQCFTPWGLAVFVLAALRDIVRLGRLARRESVGMVYSNTTAIVMGGVVARFNGLQHIQHVREIIQTPRLIGWGLAQLGRLSDSIICVSDATRNHFLSYCPSLSARTIVIHDGIDGERFSSGNRSAFRALLGVSESTLVIGMIGRLSSWKGQDLFVSAAAEFMNQRHGLDVCFVIVGNAFRGQEWREAELIQHIAARGVSPVFRVIGFREDVADVLAGFDIFTMPSTRPDPFPNTVLEAMSASRAIVANATGGVVEMIDNESGILVEPGNREALCKAWKHLASDFTFREKMGKAACRRVQSCFSLSGHLARVQALISSLQNGSLDR